MADQPGADAIVAGVERAVDNGALAPGTHLPPIRALAAEIGVNPNTVAAAYRTLRQRGVIETAGRRGSRVRDSPTTTTPTPLREGISVEAPAGARDLSTGNPDPLLLPDLRDAAAAAGRRPRPVLYGQPTESDTLLGLAGERFASDGVPRGPLAVVSGALDAVERALLAHLRPGDTVAVEDPGWHALLDLVAVLGLEPHGVGVDDEGPRTEEVERAVRAGARALVVTSRAQNPFGSALSARRAAELRPLLATHPDVLVIEDDHGCDFVSHRFQPLSGATTRWMVVRSTSKVYGPDLRLAVLTGDSATVGQVRTRQRITQGWVSHLLQDTVTWLLREAAIDPATVAARYDQRRAALLTALAAQGVLAHGRSGLNVWVPVPDEAAAISRLLNRGWVAAPGARFRLTGGPALRITSAALGPDDAPALAADVAAAVRPDIVGRST